MVRGRRVRATVVSQPDDCCSPNAKRKDKFIVPPKSTQTITKFFQPSTGNNINSNLRNGHYANNGVQDAKALKTPTIETTTAKSPATPHRIQLHNDTNDNNHNHTPKSSITDKQAFAAPAPPPPQSKARKKLLNNPPTVPPTNQTHISSFFPSVRRSVRKTKTTVLEERQRCTEDLIRNKIEDGLTVRDFASKGRGVVAARHFERGDFVVEYSGELIDMAEAKFREEKYARDDRGCYMYYFVWKNKQHCIDATAESGRLGRLVNHSRTSANLCTRIVPVDGVPRLCLVARDVVPPGDELTYDYGDRSKESLQHHPWLAY